MCDVERWVDVFITKEAKITSTRPQAIYNETTKSYNNVPLTGEPYGYDDTFCCSVQTVQFDPTNPDTAYVVEVDTPWIMPTWTTEYSASETKDCAYNKVEVGDLIRIGGMHTAGFTDYLTVVEKRYVTYLANGTNSALRTTKATGGNVQGIDFLPLPTASSLPTDSNNRITLATTGFAHIALRVNAVLNCTKLPSDAIDTSKTAPYHRQEVATSANVHATLATRHRAFEFITNPQRAFLAEETQYSEQYYFPMYLANKWSQNNTLYARLDHGVKQVSAIKLMGYSLVNKRQVGIQHAHEMHADDFVILRIREVEGHVISNNQYAHGSFAVLQSGMTSDNLIGAAEFSRYEPAGLVYLPVHASHSSIRNLTIEVTDRMGKPAHFGRFHLWFKLLVTHG